ncbi:FSIP2 family protein [Megaselia abdita]
MSYARISQQKDIIREKSFPSGVPINGLPGWENVPLHLKLPMLQTPSNQSRIIFTRAKVGNDLFRKKGDFDARILEEDKLMYNPLHDKHLRKFFSNPVMVRKLLKNDEITENLDVRCTLKEFNQFRSFIHKACLEIMTKRMKEAAEDQKNRSYLSHAFRMAHLDEQKPPERSPSGYLHRKSQIDREKNERNLKNWLRKLEMIRENEFLRRFKKAIMAHKKELFEKKAFEVMKNSREIMRSKEITYKKNLEIKDKRSLRARKNNQAMKEKKILEKSMKYYQQRLQHKYKTEEKKRIRDLQFAEKKKRNIEAHKKRYSRIWKVIEAKIAIHAGSAKKFYRKTIPFAKKIPLLLPTSVPESSNDGKFFLSNSNLKSTLNLIIDQEKNKLQFSTRESLLHKERTIKYVVREILNKFNEDLSGYEVIVEAMSAKLEKFFVKMKQQQIRKAVHIIAEKDERGVCRPSISVNINIVDKQVSFTKKSRIIGEASYEIDPDVDIKHAKNRPPTPTESLTSIGTQPYTEKLTGNSHEEVEEDEDDKEHEFIAELPVNAKIFVEHLFVRVKRRVMHGVGKMVLDSLCHFKSTQEVINKTGFLNVSMDYLKKSVAKAILGYAVNPQNYEANIILCVNTLGSQVIASLVQFLHPKRVTKWDCMIPNNCAINDF